MKNFIANVIMGAVDFIAVLLTVFVVIIFLPVLAICSVISWARKEADKDKPGYKEPFL